MMNKNKKLVAILAILTLGFLASCGTQAPVVEVVETPVIQPVEIVSEVIEATEVEVTDQEIQEALDESSAAEEALNALEAQQADAADLVIAEELALKKAEDEATAKKEAEELALEKNQAEKEKIAAEKAAAEAAAAAAAVPTTTTIASWNFQKVAVGTSGTVTFVKTGDVTTLQLSNFSTSSAPDLGIYLSKKGSISSSADIGGAIKLAQLRSPSGNQSYVVPEGIDLSQYNSVAIHCTQYNKLFGSASVR